MGRHESTIAIVVGNMNGMMMLLEGTKKNDALDNRMTAIEIEIDCMDPNVHTGTNPTSSPNRRQTKRKDENATVKVLLTLNDSEVPLVVAHPN